MFLHYHLLQPVYTLALVNENFSKSKKFYHHYQIINRIDTEKVIPGLEFVLIELTDKFTPDTISSLMGKSQRRSMRKLMVLWLRFLKETNEKTSVLPAEMQKNEHIRKAAELCERAAYTPEELLKYEALKEHIRIERAVREGTRRDALAEGLEKGKTIGLEEGEAIGLKKGEAIGLEKGEAERAQLKAELRAVHENTVINCHRSGLSVEAISTITELTPEQVMEILKRHGIE